MYALRALALSLPLVILPPSATMPLGAPSSLSFFGPPWISIEYPVNPYDQTTKNAFLVVHAFHHGTPTAFPVSGTAEGLVNGQRRSVPLSFTATSRTGAYALAKQWPNEGTWTLVVAVAQGPEDKVSAVVDLDAHGEVAQIRVPTGTRNGYTVPAPVAMATVEASLRERAARMSAARTQ